MSIGIKEARAGIMNRRVQILSLEQTLMTLKIKNSKMVAPIAIKYITSTA